MATAICLGLLDVLNIGEKGDFSGAVLKLPVIAVGLHFLILSGLSTVYSSYVALKCVNLIRRASFLGSFTWYSVYG